MSSMMTRPVRRSLERLLDAVGFHVVSYDSPAAFFDAASGLSAGCVLLDIRMPGVDGLEVQTRLNRLRVYLPVIVMTEHGDVPSAVRAMKAGAVDFLEKPFGDETLLKAIEGAFAKAGRLIGNAPPTA
jgi:two-component system response regulator FixJ